MNGQHTNSLQKLVENASQLSQGLETLKLQNGTLLDGLSRQEEEAARRKSDAASLISDGKRKQLEECMKSLGQGVLEARLMVALTGYLSEMETERHKLQAQVRRLCEETTWLRKELEEAQQQLQEAEVELVQLREEKEALEFQASLARDDLHGAQADQLTTSKSDFSFDMDTTEEGIIEDPHLTRAEKKDGAGGGGGSQEAAEAGGHDAAAEKLRSLHGRVLQHINQGRHEVATTLCKQVIRELEAEGGHDHQDVATALSILAVVYKDQGKYKDAVQYLQDALGIRERVAPQNKPALAAILNNLSVVYAKFGNYREAETHCRRALEIRQKLLGVNHPDVAKQLANLAVLCQNLGKYEEVEWYYQRALEIYQTELGPDDPNVNRIKSLLANCYLKQGKYKAAELVFREILQTANSSEPSDGEHTGPPSSWMLDSDSPAQEHRSAASDAVMDTSYSDKGGWHRSERQVGGRHSVSDTLKNLSELYRRQGKTDTAQVLAQFAVSSKKGLDANQRARVNEVLQSARGQAGDVQDDDDDDCYSVASQPVAPSTQRSPSPRLFRRGSGHFSRDSPKRKSISQSIKKLFGFKQPDRGGSVLKVTVSQGGPDAMDSNSPARQRAHPSPSPVRGTRNSTPSKDEDDHS